MGFINEALDELSGALGVPEALYRQGYRHGYGGYARDASYLNNEAYNRGYNDGQNQRKIEAMEKMGNK